MSLGKGLESLIPPQSSNGHEDGTVDSRQTEESFASVEESHQASSFGPAAPASTPKRTEHIFYIEVDKITPNPHQPRREFKEEELASLAGSIKQYGVLQPLVVTKQEIDHEFGRRVQYELLAGERRLRASKLAGFREVPAIIKEAGNQEKLELALIENVQREDLNPIEEAEAYKKLADDFSLTQEQMAERVGKSRETVANKLRLLSLPREVQQYISDELLTEGHGKVLLSVDNPERVRMLAKEAIKRAWSVRALEVEVKKILSPREQRPEPEKNPQLERYKQLVEEQLGTSVSISGNHEKGRLAISFQSLEDLERLVTRLAGMQTRAGAAETAVPTEEKSSEGVFEYGQGRESVSDTPQKISWDTTQDTPGQTDGEGADEPFVV